MRYFENLKEEKEIKNRYKELAKQFHPDLGGCTETMKIINVQYEKVMTGVYQTAGKSITEIEELLSKDSSMREALDKVIFIEDLIVELCGEWIWVTGNTARNKEVLKQAKFFWSPNKKAWYYKPAGKKSYNRKHWSINEIRATHGTKQIFSSDLKREKIG